MNSLQQELNNINQQLEHLNARKAQLEPIIAEYSDVINRVKNLVSNMIDVNVEPSNLMFDIQDLVVDLEDEPDTTPESTPEPQPGQDFPTDWINATTEAHSEQPEDYDTFYPELTPEPTPQPVKMFAFVPLIPTPTPALTQEPTPEPTPEPEPPSIYQLTNTVGWQHFSPRVYFKDDTLKLFIPRKSRYRKELEAISQTCSTILMIEKQEIHEVGDDWIVILNPVYDVAVQSVIDEFYPHRKDWTEETPKPTEAPQPEPKLTQINMQAYRRGDDVLVIGFTNKRLMNQWSKWAKDAWGDQVHISDHSDNLQGFNHCLTILWFGHPHWEQLTKLNYSLKPTEQKHQSSVTVANSEEE